MSYRIAVIGDRESVLGFKALGLSACAAENSVQAATALHSLAGEGHAIIYITEQLARDIPSDIARYSHDPRCAVILIPSKEGSLGIGRGALHRAVERAVGADILREKEQ